MEKSKWIQIWFKILDSQRQKVEIKASVQDRNFFKKCMEYLLKRNSTAEIDTGEQEAMIDALMCDLEFCAKYPDQMHQLGVEVPRNAQQ